jgi:hypothetical protein
MPIALGATVRQIVPAPIEGAVIERNFNESLGEMQYRVESDDGAGNVRSNWFVESQVEAV